MPFNRFRIFQSLGPRVPASGFFLLLVGLALQPGSSDLGRGELVGFVHGDLGRFGQRAAWAARSVGGSLKAEAGRVTGAFLSL